MARHVRDVLPCLFVCNIRPPRRQLGVTRISPYGCGPRPITKLYAQTREG